jgi:hypothetical protein
MVKLRGLRCPTKVDVIFDEYAGRVTYTLVSAAV